MNGKRGITLIALIITIIVMLILVAVTISVAMNGGLFGKATEAQTKTQRETAREELISAMVGAYNDNGNFDKDLVGTLPNGAKWCSEDAENWSTTTAIQPTGTGDWIITKENNKFYIDKNGSVLDEKPQPPEDVYYDITFNQLSSSDWDDEEIEIGKMYVIGLQHNDQNETLSMITFMGTTDGIEQVLTVMVGYVPDPMNNINTQYLYDYTNNEWSHMPNIYSGGSDFSVETLEIEGVKILTEEEMAPYLINGNMNGLPYESILYTKTLSQEQ